MNTDKSTDKYPDKKQNQSKSCLFSVLMFISFISALISVISGKVSLSREKIFHAALWILPPRFLQLLPAHRGPAGIDLLHGDTLRHRTHQRAQVTAHTFIFENVRHLL